jgi:hypothetical protein
MTRSIVRAGSTAAGVGINNGINRLKTMIPDDVMRLAEKAANVNKPELAKSLQRMANSKDPVARNAMLYMISQQHGMKQDLDALTEGEE